MGSFWELDGNPIPMNSLPPNPLTVSISKCKSCNLVQDFCPEQATSYKLHNKLRSKTTLLGQNHKNLPELIKVAEKRGIKYPINLVLCAHCAVHVSRDLKCLEKLRTNEPKKSPPLRVRIKEYGTCYKKKWTVMLAAAIFLWVLACAAWQNICELKKKNLVKDQTLSKQDEYSDFTYWTFSIN